MKKKTSISIIMTALLVIGLIIILYFSYRDLNIRNFITIYIMFIFIFVLYHIILFTISIKKTNMDNILNKLWRFIKVFAFLLISGLLFNYYFKETIDYLNVFSIAFGLSFGVAFFDLLSSKTKH